MEIGVSLHLVSNPYCYHTLKPRNYNDIDDKELLQRFYADHNNDWLGILLERYTLMLLGVCMKYLKNEEDAKDGVQQVFLKAINEIPKYQIDYFKSWIYMVAKNHCLMKLRNKGKYTAEWNDNLAATADESSSKDNAVEKDVQLDHMEAAMQHLNDEQRVCLHLFYLQKHSYQQVADKTSLSIKLVKSHIQNGKRNLKLLMQRMQSNG